MTNTQGAAGLELGARDPATSSIPPRGKKLRNGSHHGEWPQQGGTRVSLEALCSQPLRHPVTRGTREHMG